MCVRTCRERGHRSLATSSLGLSALSGWWAEGPGRTCPGTSGGPHIGAHGSGCGRLSCAQAPATKGQALETREGVGRAPSPSNSPSSRGSCTCWRDSRERKGRTDQAGDSLARGQGREVPRKPANRKGNISFRRSVDGPEGASRGTSRICLPGVPCPRPLHTHPPSFCLPGNPSPGPGPSSLHPQPHPEGRAGPHPCAGHTGPSSPCRKIAPGSWGSPG